MCYYILNENSKVLARSSIQRVTQLEWQTTEYKSMFEDFNKSIKDKLKCKDRCYEGAKPNPDNWSDLTEFDSNFNEELNKIYNDPNIPEADDFSPESLEDTYMNMELAITRDNAGPEFTKVTKRHRDADGLPIGKAKDNLLLDTCIYEVEYPDWYKVALVANTIAFSLVAQVDVEGNRHVLFDKIVDHCTDGTEVKLGEQFITYSNCS